MINTSADNRINPYLPVQASAVPSEDKSQKIGNFDKFPRPGQHQLAGGGRGMIRAGDGE